MSRRLILIADDDPADRRLLRLAFTRAGSDATFEEVTDGRALLERLADGDPPDLVLVDLNMPLVGGLEAIEAMRRRSAIRPAVLVLSTSSAEQDVTAGLAAGANAYVTKPDSLDELIAMARAIDRFWLHTARVPSATASSHGH